MFIYFSNLKQQLVFSSLQGIPPYRVYGFTLNLLIA